MFRKDQAENKVSRQNQIEIVSRKDQTEKVSRQNHTGNLSRSNQTAKCPDRIKQKRCLEGQVEKHVQ